MKSRFLFLFLLGPCAAVWAQSAAKLQANRAKLAQLPDGEARVTLLVELAHDYLSFDLDSARMYIHEARNTARRVKDLWGETSYHSWYASLAVRQQTPASAIPHLDTALSIATRMRDTVMMAGMYQTKGNVYDRMGEPYTALVWLGKGEELANKTRKGQLKARLLFDKGRLCQTVGEWEDAMKAFLSSLRLADSMGRDDLKGHIYTGISTVYIKLNDEPKVREYAQKTLDLGEKLNNPFLKGQGAYRLGVAEALARHYEEARRHFEKSLEWQRSIGRDLEVTRAQMALVRVLAQLKRYEQAENILSAVDTTLFTNYLDQTHEYRLAHAVLAEAQGNIQAAEKWHRLNVSGAEKIKDRRSINESYSELSQFYERQSNPGAALNALRAAQQILSESQYITNMRSALERELSVRSEKEKAELESQKLRSELLVEQQQKSLLESRLQAERQQKQLADLEAQRLLQDCELESKDMSLLQSRLLQDKKDGELQLLNQEKDLQAERLRAERLYRLLLVALSAIGLALIYLFYRRRQRSHLLELRTHLAQDLHDDLGSDMSGISYSAFAAGRSGDAARMRETLQNISEQSGRLVEDMRDIVWSIHPDNDSMEKMAARMRQYAAQALESQGIDVHFSMAPQLRPLKMQPEARKHLYLFFKEALHNIARHAQCTRADVNLRREKNELLLEIRDNGRGFDTAAQTTGSGGNGLRNLKQRAEVLGGKMEMDSRSGSGTSIRLRAPLR